MKTLQPAGRFALIYFLVGCVWIFTSDWLVTIFVPDMESQFLAQLVKGQFYVIITTLLVYVLLRKAIDSGHRKDEQIRALTENAKDVIWYLDLHCKVRYVNPAVKDLTGVDSKNVIGTNIRTYCTEKSYLQLQGFIENFRKNKESNEGQTFESEVLHQNGEVIPVEVRCQCIRSQDGTAIGLQGVSRDLRERQAMEARLRQAQKMESIGTLSSGIAHEINNPVTIISGHIDLLLNDPNLDQDIRDDLTTIKDKVTLIHRLVKNLLGYARVDEQPETVRFSPEDPLTKSLDLCSSSIHKDHIQLETTVDPDLPDITGYPLEIQQVLLNLIHNARDSLNEAHPESGPDKKLQIQIQEPEPGLIRYTVEDHGTGLDPKTQERLFDPFFTTKAPGKGTGLGLWIVHGVVSRHQGKIQIESEPGHYTRFLIDIPVSGAENTAGQALDPLLQEPVLS